MAGKLLFIVFAIFEYFLESYAIFSIQDASETKLTKFEISGLTWMTLNHFAPDNNFIVIVYNF